MAGDIVVVYIKADGDNGTDNFALLVLRDGGLPQGQTIKITDNGLKSDCTFRENEGTITFNSLNYVPQGGIIVYRNAAGDVNEGFIEDPQFDLNRNGDQIIVYEGTNNILHVAQTQPRWADAHENITSQMSMHPSVCDNANDNSILISNLPSNADISVAEAFSVDAHTAMSGKTMLMLSTIVLTGRQIQVQFLKILALSSIDALTMKGLIL